MRKISTPEKEGNFQAAKWMKLQMLIDANGLNSLLKALQPLQIVSLSSVGSMEQLFLSSEQYVASYAGWIERLKQGLLPEESELRPYQATAWVMDEESVWLQEIPKQRFMAKVCKPVLVVQIHFMGYSTVDGEFRPMVLSKESLFWGLQFSFPQVYQDPKTGQLLEVEEKEIFSVLRRWSRDHTVPTPMLANGKKVNLPIRLGKECFSWIDRHPQLMQHKLQIAKEVHAR